MSLICRSRALFAAVFFNGSSANGVIFELIGDDYSSSMHSAYHRQTLCNLAKTALLMNSGAAGHSAHGLSFHASVSRGGDVKSAISVANSFRRISVNGTLAHFVGAIYRSRTRFHSCARSRLPSILTR